MATSPTLPGLEPRREKKGAGHRGRLREKFLRTGLAGFLDYEVIELLLTVGTPRRDCREAAKEALREFKTFRGVLEAPAGELEKIRGLGPRSVFGLKLIHEVSRRYLKDRMMSRPVCHSSKEVFDYLYHALRDLKREQFKVIFLDPKNQIIEERTLFEGTVDSSAVYPREIMKEALRFNATALIFARVQDLRIQMAEGGIGFVGGHRAHEGSLSAEVSSGTPQCS